MVFTKNKFLILFVHPVLQLPRLSFFSTLFLDFLLFLFLLDSNFVSNPVAFHEASSKSSLSGQTFYSDCTIAFSFSVSSLVEVTECFEQKVLNFRESEYVFGFSSMIFFQLFCTHFCKCSTEIDTWFHSQDSSLDIIYFLVKSKKKFVQPLLLDDSLIVKTVFWAVLQLLFIHIKLLPIPYQSIELLGHCQVVLLKVVKNAFYDEEF